MGIPNGSNADLNESTKHTKTRFLPPRPTLTTDSLERDGDSVFDKKPRGRVRTACGRKTQVS